MFFDSFQLQSKFHGNGKPHFKNTNPIKLVSSRKLFYLKEKEWDAVILSSSFLACKMMN